MAEPLIDDETKEDIRKRLSVMRDVVTLSYFRHEGKQYSAELEQLYTELAGISPKIKLEIKDIDTTSTNAELAVRDIGNDANSEHTETQSADIPKFGPVVIIKSPSVKGDARFYGMPAGYEFSTFVESIILASTGPSYGNLLKDFIGKLSDPLKLEVFVTPTCAYCPTSALFTLKLAMISPKVKGYVYEASEFPELVSRYGLQGVPKTVINDGKGHYEGGYPEDVAILTIKEIIGIK